LPWRNWEGHRAEARVAGPAAAAINQREGTS
jgi:hypothetical protein